MREAVRDLDRLLHMQESIANIQEFVTGKTFDEFVSDKLLYFASNNMIFNKRKKRKLL